MFFRYCSPGYPGSPEKSILIKELAGGRSTNYILKQYYMPLILLETRIHARPEICFDLSTSIDLHKLSTAGTEEEAIAGRTSGLIQAGEFVTWRAKHLGRRQDLTSHISAFERPYHFRDEQLQGPFRSMRHDHYFVAERDFTCMKDRFEFESPCGVFGKMFNKMLLTNYMRGFLSRRNELIREFAESGQWTTIPGISPPV
jgi:ligand-binding SRPBCC domain-containing protein